MANRWYGYKSKDGKVKGYCEAETVQGVAAFVRYSLEDLIIKPAVWNGIELEEDDLDEIDKFMRSTPRRTGP